MQGKKLKLLRATKMWRALIAHIPKEKISNTVNKLLISLEQRKVNIKLGAADEKDFGGKEKT